MESKKVDKEIELIFSGNYDKRGDPIFLFPLNEQFSPSIPKRIKFKFEVLE